MFSGGGGMGGGMFGYNLVNVDVIDLLNVVVFMNDMFVFGGIGIIIVIIVILLLFILVLWFYLKMILIK